MLTGIKGKTGSSGFIVTGSSSAVFLFCQAKGAILISVSKAAKLRQNRIVL